MNKKIKALIIGGAVLVVLVGVLVTLLLLNQNGEGETSSSSSSSASVNVLEKNVNNIQTLTIKNAKEEIVMRQSEDSVFSVDALQDLPADQSEVKSAFSAMAVIDAIKIVDSSPEDLGEYGLDNPTVVEASFKDGTSCVLKIGQQSPLKDGYYAMLEGDSNLYLLSEDPYGTFCTILSKDYLTRAIISDNQGKEASELVAKMILNRDDIGQELVFEQIDDDEDEHFAPMYASAFVMTSPIKAYVESTYFDDIADNAISFTASSIVGIFPTDEELQQYGLTDPQATFIVEMKDGSRIEVRVGNECYGDPTEDEESTTVTGYYVQLVGRDAVYYIKTGQMPFMYTSVFDMLSQIAFAPSITEVDTLTVNAQGKEYLVDFTQEETASEDEDSSEVSVTGTVNGTAVDQDKLTDFYVYVVSALANDIYIETPSGAPILTLTFRFNDSSLEPLTVTFHDIGDRKASITINGQTRFETRMSYVTTFYDNIEAIAQNKEINPNY